MRPLWSTEKLPRWLVCVATEDKAQQIREEVYAMNAVKGRSGGSRSAISKDIDLHELPSFEHQETVYFESWLLVLSSVMTYLQSFIHFVRNPPTEAFFALRSQDFVWCNVTLAVPAFVCPEEAYAGAVRTRDLVATALSSGLEDKIRVLALGSFPSLEDIGHLAAKMKPLVGELVLELSNEGDPVVCVLSDTFNGWTQDVADEAGLPRAVFWTSNATNDVTHQFLPQLMEKGIVPVSSCESKDPIDFLPGLPGLHPTDLPFAFHQEWPVLDFIAQGAKRFPEAEFALCNTFEELEPDIVAAVRREMKANYFPVGPCLPADFLLDNPSAAVDRSSANKALSSDDVRCLEWLDKQVEASVIYVAFGSVSVLKMEQAQEVVKGLESAGKPFLLVLRKNLVSGLTPGDFFDQFINRTQHLGLVVTWAPQMQVLLHPAVGAFLTHCGWNSVLEAICSGVPMLGWPQGAEQNMNCKDVVQRWKIGIEVVGDRSFVSGTRVSSLVQRILGEEGKEMRSRAQVLRDAARKAVSSGSSQKNLKAFVRVLEDRTSSP